MMVPGLSWVEYWTMLRRVGIFHSSGSASAIICLSRAVSCGSGSPDWITGVQPLTRAINASTSPTTNTFVFIAAPSIAPLTILSP